MEGRFKGGVKLREFLEKELGKKIREDSGIGIKPMSRFGTKRLVRMAIQHALSHGRKSVTLVHKGNIMKFTEGAFRDWGYEVAKEEFGDQFCWRVNWLARGQRIFRREDRSQRPDCRCHVSTNPLKAGGI